MERGAVLCGVALNTRSWELRVFIRHRRSENSPATMQNSPAKFRWSVVVFLYRRGAVM